MATTVPPQQESTFPQSSFSRRNHEPVVILAISPKKGLYKFNFKGKRQTDIKVRETCIISMAVVKDN